MKSLRKYEHSYLLLSSLLITILINLPFLAGILSGDRNGGSPKFDHDIWFNRTLWYTFHGWVSLIIFSYLNYYWKYLLLNKNWKTIIRVLLVTIYNIILVYLLLKLTVWVAGLTIGNIFGPEKAFIFYFWRYVYIVPLAIFLAYVLNLITNTKIIEIENANLREKNMTSQLNSLKEQINPHFLFNTLNTLSSVIRLGSKKDGLDFVDKLSSVYRYILESNKYNLVKLENEIKFIHSYIFMLQKRFENKLEFVVELPDYLLKTNIPPMTLQMLIENSIKHNKLLKSIPLKIKIHYQKGFVVVENNIIENKSVENSFGLGLKNLKERYRLIAGKELIIKKVVGKFIVKLPIIES